MPLVQVQLSLIGQFYTEQITGIIGCVPDACKESCDDIPAEWCIRSARAQTAEVGTVVSELLSGVSSRDRFLSAAQAAGTHWRCVISVQVDRTGDDPIFIFSRETLALLADIQAQLCIETEFCEK